MEAITSSQILKFLFAFVATYVVLVIVPQVLSMLEVMHVPFGGGLMVWPYIFVLCLQGFPKPVSELGLIIAHTWAVGLMTMFGWFYAQSVSPRFRWPFSPLAIAGALVLSVAIPTFFAIFLARALGLPTGE